MSLETLTAFYERHPYPPAVDDLGTYQKQWNDPARRRSEALLFWPFQAPGDKMSVLVAGCGTSQAAKYAIRWPKARVVGIDLSANSIQSTEKLKRKHRLNNLDLHQLAIDQVEELGKDFDHIVCTGVLHHLEDPVRTLKALRSCLAPGGAMHLMVYAPHGRAGIYLLQDYCRRLGIGATDAEIDALMQSLRQLPKDHPIVPLLVNSPDFKDKSAIADALLHPRDRAYSVDALFDLIAACDLQFGRWIRQAPYLPQCGALTQSPHHQKLAELSTQQQFAAVELFRGNMLRHSVAVYRADETRHPGGIDFWQSGWEEFVPVRFPNTIAVEKNLPPTAAAVLINRSHDQTDIYLPINAVQKMLCQAIDNHKSIRQLADEICDLETARVLMARLWWYDQIVIDASGAAQAP